MVRRALIVVALLCIAAGATAAVMSRPWERDSGGGDEFAVDHATLHAGTIVLHLVNGSADTARLAQVIVNDAYVDFDTTRLSLPPAAQSTVAVSYPWIRGESYEIELLLSTGGAVMYDIEDAEPGDTTAAA